MDRLEDIIDFDASPVLLGDEIVEECGNRILEEMLAVAAGKLVHSEKTEHTGLVIGKVAQ